MRFLGCATLAIALTEALLQVAENISHLKASFTDHSASLRDALKTMAGVHKEIDELIRREKLLTTAISEGNKINNILLNVARHGGGAYERQKAKLIELLEDLAGGKFHAWERNMVFEEDMHLIRELKGGDHFWATVPVLENPHFQFFGDGVFHKFIECQVTAAVGKVRATRIYICDGWETAENEDFIRHLVSLKNRIDAEEVAENFKLKVIVLSEGGYEARRKYMVDIVAFGTNIVSEGKLGHLAESLFVTTYWNRQEDVSRIHRLFSEIEALPFCRDYEGFQRELAMRGGGSRIP